MLARSGSDGADLNTRFVNSIVPLAMQFDSTVENVSESDFLNSTKQVDSRKAKAVAKIHALLRDDALLNVYQLITPYLEWTAAN